MFNLYFVHQCNCVWQDSKQGPGNFGTISLRIDVPFSGDNGSSLDVAGLYDVEGWSDLQSGGHNFTRLLTIVEVGGELSVEEDTLYDESKSDPDYFRFQQLKMQSNLEVQDWHSLKKLKVQDQFDPKEFLPKKYLYPPKAFLICRTDKHTIDNKLWPGIGDPIFTTNYQKSTYVEEYFSVSFYSINTNPRKTESISAGTSQAIETTIEVTSAIKSTIENNISKRALLKTETKVPKIGSEIAAEMETKYSQTNVLEESTSKLERTTKTIKIAPSDKDRLFAVAVYRKRKNGNIDLIAISEWANEILNKSYEY